MDHSATTEKKRRDSISISVRPPSITAVSSIDVSDADDGPSVVAEQPPSETSGTKGGEKCSWLKHDPWLLDGSEVVPSDGKQWERCRNLLVNFDTATAGGWKDEIQNQLVVSSLLSAVTTAFALQVQNDEVNTATILLLSQIALQGNASAIIPMDVFSPDAVKSDPHARLINAFLFTSLALSLANVTLGIICLQWVRELVTDAPGVTNDAYCDLREVRFNGFDKGARGFVLALPLLLLFSLLSFFGGLLVFLGIEDWSVAMPVYIILLLVVAVVIITTFWPTFATLHAVFSTGSSPSFNPPFRSIQSWLVLQSSIQIVIWIQHFRSGVRRRFHELTKPKCKHWYQFDALWASWSPARCRGSLLLPLTLSTGSQSDMDSIYHCFDDWKHIDQFLKMTGTSGGRQLSVLRFLASHGVSLPPSTIGKWETRFIEQFVRVVNSGTSINDLGSMMIESRLSMRKSGLESILQLISCLIKHGDLDKQRNDNVWKMLWGALLAAIMHPRLPDSMLPSIINDVLHAAERGVARGHSDKIFNTRFLALISLVSQRPLSPTDKVVLRTFGAHPSWSHIRTIDSDSVRQLVRAVNTLPPDDHAIEQMLSDILQGDGTGDGPQVDVSQLFADILQSAGDGRSLGGASAQLMERLRSSISVNNPADQSGGHDAESKAQSKSPDSCAASMV